MKCYNHHDRDAFGICKACGKALCLECIDIVNGKVTCKDSEKCHNRVNCFSNSKGLGYYAGVLFAVIGTIGLLSSVFDFEFGRALFAVITLLIGLSLIKGY